MSHSHCGQLFHRHFRRHQPLARLFWRGGLHFTRLNNLTRVIADRGPVWRARNSRTVCFPVAFAEVNLAPNPKSFLPPNPFSHPLHNVRGMSHKTYEIWWIPQGGDEAFFVSALSTLPIQGLKKMIKEDMGNEFQGSTISLTLWEVRCLL